MRLFQKQIRNEKSQLTLELDTSELDPGQIRILKTINAIMLHVVKTEEESEYFEGSAELFKMIASLIGQSNFAKYWEEHTDIPYAEQSLEYALEVLCEHIGISKMISYDN